MSWLDTNISCFEDALSPEITDKGGKRKRTVVADLPSSFDFSCPYPQSWWGKRETIKAGISKFQLLTILIYSFWSTSLFTCLPRCRSEFLVSCIHHNKNATIHMLFLPKTPQNKQSEGQRASSTG
jgi:hypothetical protein